MMDHISCSFYNTEYLARITWLKCAHGHLNISALKIELLRIDSNLGFLSTISAALHFESNFLYPNYSALTL